MDPHNDLGEELLKQDGASGGRQPGSREAMVRQVIAQSRQQVHRWGWLTVGLWIALAAEAVFMRSVAMVYAIFIFPRRLMEGQGYSNTLFNLSHLSAVIWPVILCAAALCTVKFIVVSRQATLRQIQAELVSISEQIRTLSRKD